MRDQTYATWVWHQQVCERSFKQILLVREKAGYLGGSVVKNLPANAGEETNVGATEMKSQVPSGKDL